MTVIDEPDRLLHETDWDRVAATDADSVELKVLVAPGADATGVLADEVRRTRRRRLYLVDTAGVGLARAGVVLRLRRLGSRRADLVVRARHHAHRGVRRPGVRVELDVLPGTILRTEQLGRALDPTVAAAFCGGVVAAGALLSEEQHRFLRAAGGRRPAAVPLDTLRPHGPLVIERMRLRDDVWGGARAFLERCTLPDGSRLEELSVRCEPAGALRAAVRACRFLDEHRLRVAERHHSKTEALIETIAGEAARTPT